MNEQIRHYYIQYDTSGQLVFVRFLEEGCYWVANLSKITSIIEYQFLKKDFTFYFFRSCHTVAKDTLYFTCKFPTVTFTHGIRTHEG